MPTLNLHKHEKLKITGFRDAQRKREIKVFEAMFNPDSFEQAFPIQWASKSGVQAGASSLSYEKTPQSTLKLDLSLGGCVEMESSPNAGHHVAQRIREFLDVAYHYNGDIHEPNYLLLEWGYLKLECRLQQATINHTFFDRDGTPLRAEIKLQLIVDKDLLSQERKDRKSSPDLTHRRTVVQGDTLPWLSHLMYGSSKHCLGIARHNDLDHPRRLTPGQVLYFPPLDQLPRGARHAPVANPQE